MYHRHGIAVSERTVRGQLRRAGLHREALAAEPKAYGRYEAGAPNERWITDVLAGPWVPWPRREGSANPALTGRRAGLRYDPEDLTRIDVFLDGKPAGAATPVYHPPARPPGGAPGHRIGQPSSRPELYELILVKRGWRMQERGSSKTVSKRYDHLSSTMSDTATSMRTLGAL